MAEKIDLDWLEAKANASRHPHRMIFTPSQVLPLIARIRELERATQPGGGDPDLRDALDYYETMRDIVGGCTDGGCLVKKPAGMHTNGGCKCHKDPLKATRMMWAGSKLFDAARASLDGRKL